MIQTPAAFDSQVSDRYIEVHEAPPVPDPTILDRLSEHDVDLRAQLVPDAPGHLRIAVYSRDVLPLEQILSLLTSMDLAIVDQRQAQFRRRHKELYRINEFLVRGGSFVFDAICHESFDLAPISATLSAMWRGAVEVDRLNSLVLAAALDWREVALLRAYCRFLRQTPLPYGQRRIESILLAHSNFSATLVQLFRAQFEPQCELDSPSCVRPADEICKKLELMLDDVEGLDADRVLRAYLSLIVATTRTSFYRADSMTTANPQLALKLRSSVLDLLPEPKPFFETFVYSPEMEGVHLRYGLVARGGIRWSDRLDDFRTEILGLAKTQAAKNAVIVPAGAKGGFVIRSLPVAGEENGPGSERDLARLGRRCYRQFVTGLLSVTDNLSKDGAVVHPDRVLCRDGDDVYLVVAADKGTGSFSDIANDIAEESGYWLGDAFASGGSVGYDHKKMGITARGAWISAERHMAEAGIDFQSQPFTVVGIGDMSGDVFGNGMLLSRNIALVAAFDHRDIFIDPAPECARAWAERWRLFGSSCSSWADYDVTAISTGGGVWSRQSKSIPVAPEVCRALGLDDAITALSPNEMIRAILAAPIDLLFNGGIGTYVKASTQQHADAGDKANDAVRIDATELRARIVVEGGNLGLTALARIEFSRAGGRINGDAIDNSAGVDCSDHEVNIKVLLDTCGDDRRRQAAKRGALLADMTDTVAFSVLANNRAQNMILSDSRATAARMVAVHARMTAYLERARGLDRTLEALPSEDEFDNLAGSGLGLTSPELATLLAHGKLDLKADLSDSELFDDPVFSSTLRTYFPARLSSYACDSHPLRRQILATHVVNEIFASGGLTFAFRLREETGASAADVVRSFIVSSQVFSFHKLVAAVVAQRLEFPVENELLLEARRLLDRGARWFLANRPQPLSMCDEVDRFAAVIDRCGSDVTAWLLGKDKDNVLRAQDRYESLGASPEVAQMLAEGLFRFSLLDVYEVAGETGRAIGDVAAVYFALSDHLGIDHWLLNVSRLPRDSRLSSLVRLALRDDFYESLRFLTRDVLTCVTAERTVAAQIGEWERANKPTIERSRRNLANIADGTTHDVASLSLASRYVRSMASGPSAV